MWPDAGLEGANFKKRNEQNFVPITETEESTLVQKTFGSKLF